MNLESLPDDIILQITQSLDVAALKHLRLTSHHFNNLIHEYEKSITLNIITRFHSAEANDRFKSIVTRSLSSLRSLFALESRHRRGQWLLGVLLGRYEDKNEKPLSGNRQDMLVVRTSILNGLAILWSLADIASDVQNESLSTVECDVEAEQPSYVQRTLTRWRTFVMDLSYQDGRDYNIMRELLRGAFYHSVFENPEQDWFEMGTGDEYVYNRDSWLSWFVFSNGPRFFEPAWSSPQQNKACAEYLYLRWSSRSWNERLWEYRAGREVEMILMEYGENSAYERDVFPRRLYGPIIPCWKRYAERTPFRIGHRLSPLIASEWDVTMEFGNPDTLPRLLQWTHPTFSYFRKQQKDELLKMIM